MHRVILEFSEIELERVRKLKKRWGCSSFRRALMRAVRLAEEDKELEELEERLKKFDWKRVSDGKG